MSKKTKPFPKDIYISHEDEGKDAWLNAQAKAESFAEMGAARVVARYQLCEILLVCGVPKVQSTGKN